MSEASRFEFKDISCPVCQENRPKFLGWRGGIAHHSEAGEKTAIVRCKNCSHQYPNPMPFPASDLADIYINADEYFRGHDVEYKKNASLHMIQQFEERIGGKGKFLDVGCGIGEVLWAANESGWESIGVDRSSEFVKIGRERLGIEAHDCTLEQAGFPDDSFDAIAMSSIIEHLYDPLEVLREAHRVLRPGGWLYFDAPNEDGLYMKLGNLYMRLQRKDWVVVMAPTFPPYHVQGFNPKSLRRMVASVGLTIKELEISGRIDPQTGELSLRKKLETGIARVVNRVSNSIGQGMYMSVWAQKL